MDKVVDFLDILKVPCPQSAALDCALVMAPGPALLLHHRTYWRRKD